MGCDGFDGIVATDFSIRLCDPIYRKRSKQRHDGDRDVSKRNCGTESMRYTYGRKKNITREAEILVQ